jgi:subtilisin family serine protease
MRRGLTPAALDALHADPRVAFVTPDVELQPAEQMLPTGVDRVDGELSSTVSGDGAGSVDVNVAILDTGIDLAHPDLNARGGFDCVKKESRSFNDENGHGTHVAGIVAARDNGFGVVGLAPGVGDVRSAQRHQHGHSAHQRYRRALPRRRSLHGNALGHDREDSR